MDKKRVRWDVRVFASNYKGVKGSFPRVVQRGNVTLDQLATVLQERTGIYRADSVRAIMTLMTDLVEEYLMDGFLYCQFEKLGADDGYADIDTPAITMEGRVE